MVCVEETMAMPRKIADTYIGKLGLLNKNNLTCEHCQLVFEEKKDTTFIFSKKKNCNSFKAKLQFLVYEI